MTKRVKKSKEIINKIVHFAEKEVSATAEEIRNLAKEIKETWDDFTPSEKALSVSAIGTLPLVELGLPLALISPFLYTGWILKVGRRHEREEEKLKEVM